MVAAGKTPSQTPFLIIFLCLLVKQIVLLQKAPRGTAHARWEQIRPQGPQLFHTVGEGFRGDRAVTVSLQSQEGLGTGVGVHRLGSAILLPSYSRR